MKRYQVNFLSYARLGYDLRVLAWRWRNAPAVRAQMLDTGEFSLAAHLEFCARLPARAAECVYWLVWLNGRPCGTVRLKKIAGDPDGAWDCGVIFVRHEHRVAACALYGLQPYLAYRGITCLSFVIRAANRRSLAFFADRLGCRVRSRDAGFYYLRQRADRAHRFFAAAGAPADLTDYDFKFLL